MTTLDILRTSQIEDGYGETGVRSIGVAETFAVVTADGRAIYRADNAACQRFIESALFVPGFVTVQPYTLELQHQTEALEAMEEELFWIIVAEREAVERAEVDAERAAQRTAMTTFVELQHRMFMAEDRAAGTCGECLSLAEFEARRQPEATLEDAIALTLRRIEESHR